MPGPSSYLSRYRSCSVAITGGLLLAAMAGADSVRLKDGTKYDGNLQRLPDKWIVTLADGRKVNITPDQVVAVEVAGSRPAPTQSEERLASLRRAVENVSDLKQIVERYKGLIKQYDGTPVGEQAKVDLVTWQDRLDRKLIKVGDQWVSEDERKQIADHSIVSAGEALALLQQGRFNDASPIVDRALTESGQNAAAWFLRGLVSWKQDRTVESKRAFEQVTSLMPDLAAGHNNLAVVLWRQNQHVAALLSYDKALLAAPDSLFILDNMAEALNALPEELRNRTTVGKVVRHFIDQELLAKQRMESIGLYRWGSSWVPKAEIDRLVAIEKEIRARVDRMEVDYNAISGRVRQLDADIAAVEATIRRMETDSYVLDARTGRYVRYQLPPTYFTFVQDLGTMRAERDQRAKDQQLMRAQARQLVQSLPKPRYAGVQRMVEVDGTPILGKPEAAVAAPIGNVAMPVNGGPNAAGQQLVPPAAAGPANAVPPAVPATMPAVPPPAQATAPPAAAPMERPRRPVVPPEKPSILDRRLADPPPPPPDQPLLDDKTPR